MRVRVFAQCVLWRWESDSHGGRSGRAGVCVLGRGNHMGGEGCSYGVEGCVDRMVGDRHGHMVGRGCSFRGEYVGGFLGL